MQKEPLYEREDVQQECEHVQVQVNEKEHTQEQKTSKCSRCMQQEREQDLRHVQQVQSW